MKDIANTKDGLAKTALFKAEQSEEDISKLYKQFVNMEDSLTKANTLSGQKIDQAALDAAVAGLNASIGVQQANLDAHKVSTQAAIHTKVNKSGDTITGDIYMEKKQPMLYLRDTSSGTVMLDKSEGFINNTAGIMRMCCVGRMPGIMGDLGYFDVDIVNGYFNFYGTQTSQDKRFKMILNGEEIKAMPHIQTLLDEKLSKADITEKKASKGYIKLPGGTIIQYLLRQGPTNTQGTINNITFAIPFTTTNYVVVAIADAGTGTTHAYNYGHEVGLKTTTNFQFRYGNTTSGDYWSFIAIGY